MPDRRVLFLVLISFACAKSETPAPATEAATPPPATVASTTSAAATVTETSATAATTSTAVAPSAAAIATADGEKDGVTVAVKELKRTSGGTVSLKFAIINGSANDVSFDYNFVDRDHDVKDFGSIGGVQLIDPVGKKKYFVARDSDGKCVCSSGLKDIKPGTTINVWAKLPAPPEDVEKISIIIPHFSPMDDVPISK
jgi:hypothetical protein